MNSIEWFYATVARKPADRPAAWLGMPDILAQKSLFAEYEVSDLDALGILWSAHFQDTFAAFGMENALVNMLTNSDIYKAVDNKIVEFYLQANQIFFKATKHRLNAVLIGNDLGSQRGLMLSPELVWEFIIPGAKLLIAQAHSYGLKVIYHSCGSIESIIPDLIADGVDVIHPIQVLATGMDIAILAVFPTVSCTCLLTG